MSKSSKIIFHLKNCVFEKDNELSGIKNDILALFNDNYRESGGSNCKLVSPAKINLPSILNKLISNYFYLF